MSRLPPEYPQRSKNNITNIKTYNKTPHEGQFQYLGRWVNKENFRVFVYNDKGEAKLANNYKEYESLIASGLWFSTKEMAITANLQETKSASAIDENRPPVSIVNSRKEKKTNGTICSTS